VSGSAPRVLVTVRHPGPVHCVAALVLAVPGLDWVVAASGAAVTCLRRDHPDLASRTMTVAAEAGWAAEADPADLDAARSLLAGCRRLADAVAPDLVIRTTPATGLGADELMATAVDGQVPVLCVQDFPGIGLTLGTGQHPVAVQGPDVVAVPEQDSARWVEQRHGVPACALGWVAHERFARFPPYATVRDQVRTRLGLAGQRVVLVAGAAAEVPEAREAALLAAACGLRDLSAVAPVRLLYRQHPRRDAATAGRLRRLFAQAAGDAAVTVPGPVAGPDLLAVADLVVSGSSVLNLEVLAYASSARSSPDCGPGISGDVPPMPVSVFCGEPAEPVFAGYWGPRPPVTHRPGGGSLLTSPAALPADVAAALADPGALTTAALAYRPRGALARQAIRDWLAGYVHLPPPRPAAAAIKGASMS
jgi:hypothetical protein